MNLKNPLILASRSPRRSQLLRQVGLEFTVVPADVDESFREDEEPADIARRLAEEKAGNIAESHPDSLVLGADTIVVIDNSILGKPDSSEEAAEMLSRLSGQTHTVYSGLALCHAGDRFKVSDVVATRVTFDNLSSDLIRAYVATGSPMDKAGSYGIQDMGSFMVKQIEGDFFTVMGLPLNRLYRLLTNEAAQYLVNDNLKLESHE